MLQNEVAWHSLFWYKKGYDILTKLSLLITKYSASILQCTEQTQWNFEASFPQQYTTILIHLATIAS